MRAVKYLLCSIKNGIIGVAGGDAKGKSGVFGFVILAIGFLYAGFIIVQSRSEQLAAEKTAVLLFGGLIAYFIALLLGAALVDLFCYLRRK